MFWRSSASVGLDYCSVKLISADFCSLLHSCSFLKQLLPVLAQPAHFFLSAVLFMQTDFIICWVYWCLLGAGSPLGAAAWQEVWHRLRAVFVSKICGGSVWVWEPLGQILLCCTSSPASLGSSLHHLWRDERLIKIFFFLGSQQSFFALSVACSVISSLLKTPASHK